jgi:hypothetical protein
MAEFGGTQTTGYYLAYDQSSFTVTPSGYIRGTDGLNSAYYSNSVFASYTFPGHGGTGIAWNFFAPANIDNAGDVKGGSGGNTDLDISFGSKGVAGTGGTGIDLVSGGTVTNSGEIVGGRGGYARGAGVDGGAGGAGIYVGTRYVPSSEGVTVANYALIEGGDGGYGRVTGGSGGAGVDLQVYGQVFNGVHGNITGGSAAPSGEGVAGAAGAGVDLGAGGSVIDAGLIRGGAGSYDYSGTAGTGGAGVDLAAGGSLDVERGALVIGGAGGGQSANYSAGQGGVGVDLNGGSLTTAGTIRGGSGGSLMGDTGTGPQGYSVEFGSSSATMFVQHYAKFYGQIGGFHYGDTVDLTNLSTAFVESHFNAATDTINSILDGTLQFAGDPQLIFSDDGSGGTLVTCACFRQGTRIQTDSGERAIETLAIGDRVMTLSGVSKPIRWIGRRHYSGATLGERRDARPVLIHAGALGEHSPRRDLWVSPEHALYLHGALVPAALLTNGVSIHTDDSVGSVSYYHLEFDSHAVIFAEGSAAESFVDDNSRGMFDNAEEYARLYPDALREPARFSAPRVEDGEALEALRAALKRIAGVSRPPSAEASHLDLRP